MEANVFTEILQELKLLMAQLSQRTSNILDSVTMEVQKGQNLLEIRLEYWRKRKEELQSMLEEANSEDCEAEGSDLTYLFERLRYVEERIESINRSANLLEEAINYYLPHHHHIKDLIMNLVPKAQHFLVQKQEELTNYWAQAPYIQFDKPEGTESGYLLGEKIASEGQHAREIQPNEAMNVAMTFTVPLEYTQSLKKDLIDSLNLASSYEPGLCKMKLEFADSDKMDEYTNACTKFDPASRSVRIVWNSGLPLEEHELDQLRAVLSGWHPKGCTKVKAIWDHEMGHAILAARDDWNGYKAAEALFGEDWQLTWKEQAKTISQYAWKGGDPAEAFAETYSQFVNAPEEMDPVFLDRMKKYLEEGNSNDRENSSVPSL
uniref:Uncharacterized protein n=1 Tax=candidate division WOR-3 bacterium TaxID=2052148 RepID=A0A7V3NU65_UNCW3